MVDGQKTYESLYHFFSENLRIIIPEVVFEDRADILYKKISISVPCKSEKLVGNVMSGMKP